jgi:hypothetical protein
MTPEERPKHEYAYFVDGVKYETQHAVLTGAQIKAAIPNFDPSYALYLEEPGDHPDRLIKDDDSVSLSKEEPRRFYLVPPATFGMS